MNDFVDTIHSALSAPLAQVVSDATLLATGHPILTFMTLAAASVYVLNRSGSAR